MKNKNEDIDKSEATLTALITMRDTLQTRLREIEDYLIARCKQTCTEYYIGEGKLKHVPNCPAHDLDIIKEQNNKTQENNSKTNPRENYGLSPIETLCQCGHDRQQHNEFNLCNSTNIKQGGQKEDNEDPGPCVCYGFWPILKAIKT